jgi:hypothetical protein
LSADAERTLEEFKNRLAKEAREHQVRFDKRVEAIGEIYDKLVKAKQMMEDLVSAWTNDDRQTFRAVQTEFIELQRGLERKRIYLPPSLCEELNRCIALMWRMAVAAGIWPGVDSPQHRQKAKRGLHGSADGDPTRRERPHNDRASRGRVSKGAG